MNGLDKTTEGTGDPGPIQEEAPATVKSILSIFYSEPVITLLTVNAVVAALAAEGKIEAWISVVVLAATAPLLRRFVSPDKGTPDPVA